jgi:hypothetical protein
VRRLLAAALLAGVAALAPGTGHAATPSPCVAVIVDSGQWTRTGCTGWSSGMTGYDALTSTGHTLAFRPTDGLLCQVDGVPPTCRADTTHYWAYWHRPPGGSAWTYSQLGGGAYHPAANSTEGWAYVDGGQSARQPANVAFTTICPPPAPPPAPPQSPRTTAGGAPAGRSPAAPPSPGATAAATTTPASGVAGASNPPPATSTGGAGRRASPAGAVTHGGGGGPGALPALIAAALVVALGAGAAWQVRRRRRGVTGPTA